GAPTNIILSKNTPTLSTNPQVYKIDTRAGYAIDTANYKDFIIFNVGVRYDDYSINSANNAASQRAKFGLTSYNAGLVIKPAEEISLYTAFATSADPVGDEVDATASAYGGLAPTQPTSQIFGPQKAKAYEAGVKWSLFDDHVLATAAAFRTDVTNARETAPANLPGYTSGQIYAKAAYRVTGLDFGITGNITDDWSIQSDLVVMTPKVTRSIVPTDVGLQLANIAPQSFNLLTKYMMQEWLAVGGQALYGSQIKGGSLLSANGGVAYPNTPYATMIPSYWRFDVFAETVVTKNILVRLNVTNIFNKTYYNALYQSAVPFVQIAPGRAVYLTAEVKL
ncbi:MAG TPA: TonB-dependent receptor, partial [Anaerolineales bacterium]|nr:TonB-dependent receptor [Anaerolineales bacterium]